MRFMAMLLSVCINYIHICIENACLYVKHNGFSWKLYPVNIKAEVSVIVDNGFLFWKAATCLYMGFSVDVNESESTE